MTARMTLMVKNGPLVGRTFTFPDHGELTLGRGDDCEVQLPDRPEFRSISRRHCRITIDPLEITVRDVGSINGTYLNGMQIGRPAAWHFGNLVSDTPCCEYDLTDGDELRLGNTVFHIEIFPSRENDRDWSPGCLHNRQLSSCA